MMLKAWQWAQHKFGRLITGAGVLLGSIETLDISVIKDPLEGLIGHKGVQVIVVGLFVASFVRHQYVASQHPTPISSDDGK